MATEEQREAFWDWWVGSEEALTADVSEEPDDGGLVSRLFRRFGREGGRGLQAALADVDEALALVHPGITSDFGPRGWVFSGLGDRRAHNELVALIRACPDGVDRPAAGLPRQRIESVTVGKHTFHRSQLRFVLVLRDQGLVLGVIVDGHKDASEEQIQRAVGRMIAAELGEATAIRLAEWRVISPDSQSARSSRPFDELLRRVLELLDSDGFDALLTDETVR